MNRRSFAESLAVAALAPVLGVPVETLRLDLRRLDGTGSAAPVGSQVDTDGGSAAATALALVEIIRLEYGSSLTAAELGAVAHQIQAGLDRADLIRRADQDRGV